MRIQPHDDLGVRLQWSVNRRSRGSPSPAERGRRGLSEGSEPLVPRETVLGPGRGQGGAALLSTRWIDQDTQIPTTNECPKRQLHHWNAFVPSTVQTVHHLPHVDGNRPRDTYHANSTILSVAASRWLDYIRLLRPLGQDEAIWDES